MLGEIPWYTYVGPFGALAAAISTSGFRDPRKRHPGIRMIQTFGYPRTNYNPVELAAATNFSPGGYVPLAVPGYSGPSANPLLSYQQLAPVALSGLGGSGVNFGQQGPRPVHVAPPAFALDPCQARLQAVLNTPPAGGLSGLGVCMTCKPHGAGLQGLGAISIPGSAPPQLYTDPIPGARSTEEGLFQQSLQNGTTTQANQAYEDARAQGASHDEAVAYAAPIAQGVVQGAAGGILGGIASIVGSLVGPLAGAGTSIYQTIEAEKLAKLQAKQRAQELLIMQETRRRDQEYALQAQQASGAFWSQHGGAVAGGGALALAALGALAYFSRGKGGKKKGRRR